MPEEIARFCEFWNELKNIYKETYPDAYKKHGFPDGETFLAIDYLTENGKSSIKKAVETGCVAPDTYENIKNILRTGKLDDKIASEDKQQILEDKWEEPFEDIRREWYTYSYSEAQNHYSIIAEAKEFIKEVNKVKKEQMRAEEAARRLAEQQKAAEEAEKKRQAEFEKIFREEDKEAKTEADERYEEQKQLKYLQEDAEQNKKMVHRYLEYAAKVAQKEEEREQRKAKRLEAEQSWTEEYREEIKLRREIYRQNREKEEKQRELELELELEQQKRELEEAREKKKREDERRVAKSEALKNDLKNWLSACNTSLAEKKEDMKQAKEQYQQNPEGLLELAKTLARLDAEMAGLQNHTQFSFGIQKDIDQLEAACSDMHTQEAKDEFQALIDQGKECKKAIDSTRYQVYRETKNLPEYIRDFIAKESQEIEEDLFDKYQRSQEYQEKRQKARDERLKTITEQYQKELEEKRKKEAAERKRKEEEAEKKRLAEEAEKKRKEQEEAEKKRKEQEEAEKKRKEQEEAEKKRKEQEEAEKKRKEQEEAEKKRKEQEEAEKKRKEQEAAETRKDIFSAYDAVKDTKNRNFLKSHNKFAEMKAALQAYKEAFPDGKAREGLSKDEEKAITDRAYETCLAYLKSHLATNQAGSSMKGQETPEGRLRKQAVVQIMENMKKLPEFKDKQELFSNDQPHEEAGEKKLQPNENQRERINFSQLKDSLAAKSKVNHQKAYAELEAKKAQKNQMRPKK